MAGDPYPPIGPESEGGESPGDGACVLAGTGAFLLVTAAVLFEVLVGRSGQRTPADFAVVAGVETLLGLGAAATARSGRLRPLAPIVLAATLVMLPLVLVAAAVFLRLAAHGLRPVLALGLGGVACAGVYGASAYLLRSAAYGLLAVVAMALGSVAGALAVAGTTTAPLVATTLVAVMAALDGCSGAGRVAQAFGRWSSAAVVGALGLVIAWAQAGATRGCATTWVSARCGDGGGTAVGAWVLPATLSGCALALVLGDALSASRRAGAPRRWRGPAVALGALAALAVNWSASGGRSGAAVAALGIGTIVWGAGALWPPRPLRLRYTGLWISAVALGTGVLSVRSSPRSLFAPVSCLALAASVAGLCILERRLFGGGRSLTFGAWLSASAAGPAIATALGTTVPVWYLAGPAAALVAIGIVFPQLPEQVQAGRLVCGAGLAAVFLATLGQALSTTHQAPSLAALIAEGVGAVALGVWTRHRTPVAGGAAAVALGALLALLESGSSAALFAVVSVFALGLLGTAALRLSRAGQGPAPDPVAGTSWRRWT